MAPQPPLTGTRITALFDGGAVVGSAGCSTYSAAYTATEGSDTLPVDDPVTSESFCDEPEGVMEQEATYLALLGQVERYAISGEFLHLRDGAGTILLTYRPLPPEPLLGTEWRVVEYDDAGAMTPVVPGTQLTAVFGADDVAGSAGCNPYVANTLLDQDALTLSVATPSVGPDTCTTPAGIMEQEAAFLAALVATATYRVLGDRLTLYGEDGAAVLQLAAPYIPEAP